MAVIHDKKVGFCGVSSVIHAKDSFAFIRFEIMKFITWLANSFEIHTSLSPEKILDVLQENTASKESSGLNRDPKYFEGACFKDGFKIKRINNYEYPPPIVTGLVIPEGSGAIVKITMKPHPFVVPLMTVWFICVILGALGFITKIAEEHPFTLESCVWIVALNLGIFWFEALKQQKKLITLLKY